MGLAHRSLLLIFVLALAACGTTSPQVDSLSELEANEGIIFGSFIVEAPVTEDTNNPLVALSSRKSESLKYDVEFAPEKAFKPGFEFTRIEPNTEIHFAHRLEAGQYTLHQIQPVNLLNTAKPHRVGAQVEVIPGAVTYVGRVVVEAPERVRYVGTMDHRIDYDFEPAMEWLEREFPQLAVHAKPSSGEAPSQAAPE